MTKGAEQALDVQTETTKLSVLMRTRKCIDHLEQGKCGPSGLTHSTLDIWIAAAELLEEELEALRNGQR